ncbi:hypothetical protein [Pseudoalteromonas rubra]|uniref:hypothetical protein n=1 Tax=Pseudoalteromonas rubra TaxID=43658 RepID=UPI000B13EEE4|nr:hypothetical protein [Pseudoalteromonas rubra]
MKKIRPLTLLTKLASLVKLTDRKMSRDLSNDKSLLGGQKKFVAGCGLYRSDKPSAKGPYKPVRPGACEVNAVQVLSEDLSMGVMGGTTAKKPPRSMTAGIYQVSSLKTENIHELSKRTCSSISGSTGYKPPREKIASFSSNNSKPDHSKISLNSNRIETDICTYISGGTTGYKPPRVARELSAPTFPKNSTASQELTLKMCNCIYGGSGAYKPPRVARIHIDSDPIIPVESSQG